MRKLYPILATLLVLATSGCAPQVHVEAEEAAIREATSASSHSADVEAIKTLIEQSKAAFVSRDLERFVAVFSDDIVAMPPGQLPIVGIEEWRLWLSGWWDELALERFSFLTDEIVVAGNWAFERHTDSSVSVPKAEGAEKSESHYWKGTWILQRQADGFWKVARYIWNKNPAPVANQ